MNRGSRDELEQFSPQIKSSRMNWSFVLLAQHEDPEVGSVLQVTIQHICFEKKLKKIRNAEMRKIAVEK
jgi:hypothetical protein